MSGLRMGFGAMFCFVFLMGCSSGAKDENANLRRQNQELHARVNDLESRVAGQDPARYAQLQNELAQREGRIRELESQLRSKEPGSDPGIAGIETSYDRRKGELTVNLPSDILFAPGSADLKPTARATLDKVVAALRKDYAGKRIRVEGHTDPDPVVRTRNKWTDNLDLSLNRAAAVTRHLVSRKVDGHLITTSGFGDAHPKGGKATSRRVEIVVVTG